MVGIESMGLVIYYQLVGCCVYKGVISIKEVHDGGGGGAKIWSHLVFEVTHHLIETCKY